MNLRWLSWILDTRYTGFFCTKNVIHGSCFGKVSTRWEIPSALDLLGTIGWKNDLSIVASVHVLEHKMWRRAGFNNADGLNPSRMSSLPSWTWKFHAISVLKSSEHCSDFRDAVLLSRLKIHPTVFEVVSWHPSFMSPGSLHHFFFSGHLLHRLHRWFLPWQKQFVEHYLSFQIIPPEQWSGIILEPYQNHSQKLCFGVWQIRSQRSHGILKNHPFCLLPMIQWIAASRWRDWRNAAMKSSIFFQKKKSLVESITFLLEYRVSKLEKKCELAGICWVSLTKVRSFIHQSIKPPSSSVSHAARTLQITGNLRRLGPNSSPFLRWNHGSLTPSL